MSALQFAGRSILSCLHRRPTVRRNPLRNLLKRPSSSKPPRPADARTNRSIPGPSWYWLEPITAPFRAYGRMQHRSPYTTQLSSSLIIYWLGDLSAQLVAGSTAPGAAEEGAYTYEPMRGIRAMVIGGISAIPSYKWFLFLGTHFNYTSHAASIGVKILVNQAFFTPIFNSYFFGMQSLLAGSSLAEAKERVLSTVPVSWKNSWKVWPAVTAFSFTFIGPQFRSVFAGVVAIGWQTYLSWLNMRAAGNEAAGRALKKGGGDIQKDKTRSQGKPARRE